MVRLGLRLAQGQVTTAKVTFYETLRINAYGDLASRRLCR